MCYQKPLILIVGSDIHSPPNSMEARMVGTIVRSLEHAARFKLISIVYGAPRRTTQLHASESVIDVGWFGGPVWWRKIRYFLTFVRIFLRETRTGVDTCWFIWVGFPGLTKLAIRRARGRGAFVVATVLSRATATNRYAESDALVFSSRSLLQQYAQTESAKKTVVRPPAAPGMEAIRSSRKPPRPYFVFASAPRTPAQVHDRGVEMLFDACARLRRADVPLTVKFLNRWPAGRKLLDRLRTRYDADNVEIIDNHVDDLDNLIAAGCGVVIPYLKLDQGDVPLSAIESWAVGRPVVCTALPGIVELLDRHDAGKVSGLSGDSLAEALAEVAESALSRRESCLELSRLFDSRLFVAGYRQLLVKLP